MKPFKTAFGLCLAAGQLFMTGCSISRVPDSDTAQIKIVAFNDFHGQLESPGNLAQSAGDGSNNGIPIGGADQLAGYVANLKRQNPNTIVVSAGDLIGASPLISALFHDEGTIEVMNRLGLDMNAVGNHEFDEGKTELQRMRQGGCHPTGVNTCRGAAVGTPVPFEGARFEFLAANVIDIASGRTLFPAYTIKHIDGVRIAFIGMTLKETATIVSPDGISGLAFLDETETVNALVPKLRADGVEAVVLLIHQGGTVPAPLNVSTINRCDKSLAGSPIETIVAHLDDAVDLVISGHTHQAYNCRIANRRGRLIPVTSASAQGRLLTDIRVWINRSSGDITGVTARNMIVDRNRPGIEPDATIKTLVDKYGTIAEPLANRVIGRISADISGTQNDAGESALGDLIADSQLAATRSKASGGAEIAFINQGSIRTDLSYASSRAGEGDGNITYTEAFAVQPFGNNLVTMSLTGAQIHTLLEQQFRGCTEAYPDDAPSQGQPVNRILQVSAGFHYGWRASGAPCHKVDPGSITLNGIPVDAGSNYRVTVNSFLANGGDQFYLFRQGGERLGGVLDLDALERYFSTNPLIRPDADHRITRID
ncbi:bifunctional metallophosphatase/5'-nucleotidase [Methylomonas sp. MgM2]